MAYIDKYGVEYSEDKKTLVKCPKDFQGAYSILEGVITIGNHAFQNCNGLTSIEIPNSVTTIEWCAFYGCRGLTSVTIPQSITTIENNAFYNVNNIVYSGTATGSPWEAKCVNGYVDGYLVYEDATKTTLCGCSTDAKGAITIPNSVTTIGNCAFSGCSGLTSVTIPNSVTTIGERAFSGCRYLTSVVIPNSVTSIAQGAFLYVRNIVYYGGHGIGTGSPWGAKCINGYVDGYFVYRSAIKNFLCDCSSAATGEITIPDSVRDIGHFAFSGCYGLISIVIPNSVRVIGHYAFSGCYGLTSVTIGVSVTTIRNNAFSGCRGLISVTIPNSVRTIGDEAFNGCTNIKQIIVPKGQKERFSQMSALAEIKDKIIEKDSKKEE